MAKIYHSRLGIGALAAYASLIVVTAIGLYALGAGTNVLPSPFARSDAEQNRYGKLLVRSDDEGRCRAFALDNRTQELVERGTVVCDPERQRRARQFQRSRADSFREAFGGGK
jgi:hypothetical protein